MVIELKQIAETDVLVSFHCPNCGNKLETHWFCMYGGGSVDCEFCGIMLSVCTLKNHWLEIHVLKELY